MSVSSLTPSPLTHYSSGPIHTSEVGDTPNYSPLNSHQLLQDINDSTTSIPITSSPIVHSELVSDYNGSDSSSYLATPYMSLPVIRGHNRSLPQEEEDMVTPNSSPLMLRPSSGRLMGGMKKLLRIPSSGQAGVATSTAHAENPSIAIITQNMEQTLPELEQPDRKFIKQVLTHIKRPRYHHFSGLKRHRIRKRDRTRTHHHHYSGDDGYTSDPGILRDVIINHEEDIEEEEEDTESGDPEIEHRTQRITAIGEKLEKYKKLLLEEEMILQGFENDYVLGMEGSMSDKETNRIKQKFITKQSKAKETIDHLKKKVDKYEEQLQYLKEGGVVIIPQQRYGRKMRSGIKRIGGMKNELKERLKRKKPIPHAQATNGELDDDDLEGAIIEEDDILMTESHPSDDQLLLKDDVHCEFCIGDYSPLSDIIEQIDLQKLDIMEIQKQHGMMLEKLLAERDKSDRLESELNTLMDLHQHGVIELREQLAQMERLTFSKNQDLEDTIENCQSRLHKLEVEVNKTVDEKKAPVSSSWIRRLFVPLLTLLLDFLSFAFRISEHIGIKSGIALFVLLLAVYVFYLFVY